MSRGMETIAELMDIAARTAPKAAGQDYVEIKRTTEEERASLAAEMRKMGNEKGKPNWERDAKGVEASEALMLIGIKTHKGLGLDCRACGYTSCEDFNAAHVEGEFRGPNCMLRLLDLGIALGSAVKTAQLHNADNRIMYRAGAAARRLGIMESNVIMGIPLSATGKNIYFDR
jgi:uncharacterized ferredoxin-like protein